MEVLGKEERWETGDERKGEKKEGQVGKADTDH